MAGITAGGWPGFEGTRECNPARFAKGMLLIIDSVISDMTARAADRCAIIDKARITVDLNRTVTVFVREVVVKGGTSLVVVAGIALVGAAMA